MKKSITTATTTAVIVQEFSGMDMSPMQQLGYLRKRTIEKEQPLFLQEVKLVEKKDKKGMAYVTCEYAVTTMQENIVMRSGVLDTDSHNFRTGNSSSNYDKATLDMIVFDLSQCTSFNDEVIYASGYGMKTNFYRFVEDSMNGGDDSFYVNIKTGRTVSSDKKFDRVYKLIGNAPSGVKKMKTLAYNIANGENRFKDVMNIITEGMFESTSGIDVSPEKYSKLVARYFQCFAPNTSFGQLNSPAIYFGEFADGRVDGAAWVCAKALSNAINRKLELEDKKLLAFTEEELLGVQVQMRPFSTKVNACSVNMKNLMAILSSKIGNENIVRVDISCSNVREELDKAFRNEKSLYDGKIVVFGNGDIDFISDTNGYKERFDYSKKCDFRVLDITDPDSANFIGGANTSIQMLSCLLYNDAIKTLKLIEKLAMTSLDEELQEMKVELAEIYSYEAISKNFHSRAVIEAIAPEFANKDSRILQKRLQALLVKLESKLSKMSFAVDGNYSRIIADVSILSGIKILDYNECFLPGSEQYFKTVDTSVMSEAEKHMIREKIAVMIKYPKIGSMEYGYFKCVSLKEIKRRLMKKVKEGETSNEIFMAIYSFYKNFKQGGIIIAAEPLLMQQCAGLDFDWDGATIVVDARLTSLFKNETMIVSIKSSKTPSSVSIITGADTIYSPFKRMLASPNENIGTITNNMLVAQGLLYQLLAGHKVNTAMKIAYDMLSDNFENVIKGEKQYFGLLKEEKTIECQYGKSISANIFCVDKDIAKECIKEMGTCDWTNKDNIIKILSDMEVIYRFYQESTIDASKTGMYVEIGINPAKKYKNVITNNVKMSLEWDGIGEVVVNVDNNNYVTEKKIAYEDMFFYARGIIANKIKSTIEYEFAEAGEKSIVFSKEEALRIKNVVELHKEKADFSRAILLMGQANHYYGDLIANKVSSIEKACGDEEMENAIKKTFDEQIAALRNMIRTATKNLSTIKRAYCALAVSSFIVNESIGKERNVRSSFIDIVLPEEMLVYINSRYAWYAEADVELNEDVKTSFLFDGSSKEATITNYDSVLDDKYKNWKTGEFSFMKTTEGIKARRRTNFFGDVIVFNDGSVEEGDAIVLKNGIEVFGRALTSTKLSGKFTVRSFNGKLYASKSVEESIEERLAPTFNEVVVRIKLTEELDYKKVIRSISNASVVEIKAKGNNYGVFSEGQKIAGIDCNKYMSIAVNGFTGKVNHVVSVEKDGIESVIITVRA